MMKSQHSLPSETFVCVKEQAEEDSGRANHRQEVGGGRVLR